MMFFAETYKISVIETHNDLQTYKRKMRAILSWSIRKRNNRCLSKIDDFIARFLFLKLDAHKKETGSIDL